MLQKQRWQKMFEKRQQNRNDLIRIKITSYYQFANATEHHRGEHSIRYRPLKSLKHKPHHRFAFFYSCDSACQIESLITRYGITHYWNHSSSRSKSIWGIHHHKYKVRSAGRSWIKKSTLDGWKFWLFFHYSFGVRALFQQTTTSLSNLFSKIKVDNFRLIKCGINHTKKSTKCCLTDMVIFRFGSN